MKKSSHKKLIRRIVVAFGVQIVLLVTVAGYAVDRISALAKHASESVAVNQHEFALVAELKDVVAERLPVLERLGARTARHLSFNTFELDASDQRYVNTEANLETSFTQNKGTLPEEVISLREARANHLAMMSATRNFLKNLSEEESPASLQVPDDLSPLLIAWRDTLAVIQRIQLDQNKAVGEEAALLVTRARWIILVTSSFATLVSAALAWDAIASVLRLVRAEFTSDDSSLPYGQYKSLAEATTANLPGPYADAHDS